MQPQISTTQARDSLAQMEASILEGAQVNPESFASAKAAQAEAEIERLQKQRQDRIDHESDAARILAAFKDLDKRASVLASDNTPAELEAVIIEKCVEFYNAFANYNRQLGELEKEAQVLKVGALNPNVVPAFRDGGFGLDFGSQIVLWRTAWDTALQQVLDKGMQAAKGGEHRAAEARQGGN